MAKATLCLKGHKLYSEVWNDQPPLHTFLLTQLLKHVSPSILCPRLVTVGAAILLLASTFTIALRAGNIWTATIATGLLIASPAFLELSSSCMVEIPALAPAAAALCALTAWCWKQPSPAVSAGGPCAASLAWRLEAASAERWERAATHLPEILAGVLFGVSFQIKFINAPLLAIAALALWLRHRGGCSRLKMTARSLLIVAGSMAITFVGLNYVADGGSLLLQFRQSWAAHFAGTKSFEYGSPGDRPFDWSILLKNWDVTLPALLGVVALLRFRSRRSGQDRPNRRAAPLDAGRPPGTNHESPIANYDSPFALLPVAWLALSLLVFGTHKPWWTYYYIHNAVPLCWCAGIGLDALRRHVPLRGRRGATAKLRRRRVLLPKATRAWGVILALYVACAVPWLAARLYLQVKNIRSFPKIRSSLVLKEIEPLKPFADWLYTDEPIYSFHTGIPMPPQYAVVALKRFWSGDMTNERIAADLWSLRPSIMLLVNDAHPRPFQDLLNREYRLIYMDGEHRLYARRDVLQKAEL